MVLIGDTEPINDMKPKLELIKAQVFMSRFKKKTAIFIPPGSCKPSSLDSVRHCSRKIESIKNKY